MGETANGSRVPPRATRVLSADGARTTTPIANYTGEIKSVAPAYIVVIEADAPVRVLSLGVSERDEAKRRDWVRSSPRREALLAAAFDARDELGQMNEGRWIELLESA